MKTALIAGATGLTGTQLLKHLAVDTSYSRIITIGRRQPGVESPKLSHIITNIDEIDQFSYAQQVDVVFCCLGTTIKKAGSQAEFRKVDFEAVLQLGRWAVRHNVSRFIVISSVGANAKSSNFYLRTKGEMEEALSKCGLPSVVILRPSLLTGKRNEFRFTEKMSIVFMKAINPLLGGRLKRYRSVEAASVARCMIGMASAGKSGLTIIESEEIIGY